MSYEKKDRKQSCKKEKDKYIKEDGWMSVNKITEIVEVIEIDVYELEKRWSYPALSSWQVFCDKGW